MTVEEDDLATRLGRLEDRRAIEDLLVSYARAVDSRDGKALAACFASDAAATFSGMPAGTGGEAIAEFLLSTLGAPDRPTTHVVSNVGVELHGDRASAISNAVVYGIRGTPEQLRLRGISYHDELLRTSDGWRIQRRTHAVAWEGGAEHVPHHGHPTGRRTLGALYGR